MRNRIGLGLVVLFCILAAETARGGKYNPTLSIGDQAPVWSELPGVDGKTHALADLQEKSAVVVAFTCNTCPYAVDYEKRIIDFVSRRCGVDSKVALVAINVNLVPEDNLEAMTQRAALNHFNFPYLHDATQALGRKFGATYTPEFFVLDQERKIVYMGAMDDNPVESKAKMNYVEQAVDAVLSGAAPEVQETVAIGCTVRYKRVRRGQ